MQLLLVFVAMGQREKERETVRIDLIEYINKNRVHSTKATSRTEMNEQKLRDFSFLFLRATHYCLC